MTLRRPDPFPTVVCWDRQSRTEVMNTIALDVRESIFQATHYPCFLKLRGPTDNYIPIDEKDFLEDFLADHPHVFCIGVGDSGTGKSHLIRWMFNEIKERQTRNEHQCQVVLVPRSSANLSDVIRHIIRDFKGENIDRILRELEKSHRITLEGAKIRVLDELAFVLNPINLEESPLFDEIKEEQRLVRELLPALLYDLTVRTVLMNTQEGIISRLSKHVYGQREVVELEAPDLKWSTTDLEFTPEMCQRTGGDSKELANMLMSDPEMRQITADILNSVLREALNNLLGLRRGDLGHAMHEIRKELLSQNKELILLIEDMSVTLGLDAELIEALLVRTRDTGEEICKLRSIIGLTNEDFVRLRENIAIGRTHKVVFFNVEVSDQENSASTKGGITIRELVDFASLYLNATRYSLEDLEKWYHDDKRQDHLPSFCIQVECPNLEECHQAFGEVKGRGLYPLSSDAIMRLYRNVSSSIGFGVEQQRSFNPRLLVSRVLNAFLEDGENNIPRKSFPNPLLLKAFQLKGVGAKIQHILDVKFPQEAQKLRAALEIYANDPNQLSLVAGVNKAFGLPSIEEPRKKIISEVGPGTEIPEKKQEPRGKKETREPATEIKIPESDEFDRWLNEGQLPDNFLNRWRQLVYRTVQAWIDWDMEGLATLRDQFGARNIKFEGQFTQASHKDVTLEIPRNPQTAIALRGLDLEFRGSSSEETEEILLCASRCIESWAEIVKEQLRKLIYVSGDLTPTALAAGLLALGALILGRLTPDLSETEMLDATLASWPEDEPKGRTAAWCALWRSYKKNAEPVRHWLHKKLSCSKGAALPSPIIEPSIVLPQIKIIQQGGTIGQISPECTSLVEFKALLPLYQDVEKHLTQAIDGEKRECNNWINQINLLLNGSINHNLAKILVSALDSGAREDLLSGKDSQMISEDLRNFDLDRLIANMEMAKTVAQINEPHRLIGTLSKINREFMEKALRILQNATRVVEASIKIAEDRIAALSRGENPKNLEVQVAKSLSQIIDNLEIIDK